jgi:hypothetical protein
VKVERSGRRALPAGDLANATGIFINYSTSKIPGFLAANIWIAWVSLTTLTVALLVVEIEP